MKSEKGMSLVVLVLTIIVLLGIAAVSIYMVIGPNGVLNVKNNSDAEAAKNATKANLATALTRISKDYSEEKIPEATSLSEALTKEKLQGLLPNCTITQVIAPKEGVLGTVKITENDCSYTAAISDKLEIQEFVKD